jgi:hypothetical protein
MLGDVKSMLRVCLAQPGRDQNEDVAQDLSAIPVTAEKTPQLNASAQLPKTAGFSNVHG